MLFRPSRATIYHMHPCTLEVLRPSGVTEALLDRGNAAPSAELHLGHRDIRVPLADFDLADTAFPHLLRRSGRPRSKRFSAGLWPSAAFRWNAAPNSSASALPGAPPQATVARRDGVTEDIGYRYLVGCDGAGSTVRRLTGVHWSGAW